MTAEFSKYRLLFLSTPVGALGTGMGGGVELTLRNLVQIMTQRGHHVDVVAPAGSNLSPFPVIPIAGELQASVQAEGRDVTIHLPKNSVLAHMWDYVRQVQLHYDVLVNFAYDWLPFYLTPWLQRPVAHLVSMGSLSDAMDGAIAHVALHFPKTIAVHSRVQAETFTFSDRCRCLSNGLDLSLYTYGANPEPVLGWVGRLAPEKGLEDAIAAVERAGIPLKIWGAITDPAYWAELRQRYPNAPIHYEGFLPTAKLQAELGQCRAILMTPRWVEAFGNVAIEALACGVPVISYRRGGPSEIVRHGETGWLVEPDSVDGLVEAIAKLDQIDRRNCRQQAEAEYSLDALGDRMEQWLQDILMHEPFQP